MKISIDVHGVLNQFPEKFIKLSNIVRAAGGKVFIITGPPAKRVEKELLVIAQNHNGCAVFWDELHSVSDYVIDNGITHSIDDKGNLWTADGKEWDEIKSKITKNLGVDLHFDDSEEYKEYFEKGVFCSFNS